VSTVLFAASARSFQLRVSALRGPGDEGPVREVLALFLDITQMERLEAVRREFVANVSHELRTPLTSIKAFVETLTEDGLSDEANAQRFLGIIRKHADRMGELIADLTDLSLIETGAIALDIQSVDAAEIAEGVVERLEPLADNQGVEVVVEMESPFTIRADRRRLEQMLTNLVDNAVKFSEKGGRVWIRGRANGNGSTLSVKDEGAGIPRESLEKVFHRFHQESKDYSRERGGTGLGLAIVKHLMRLHEGRVRVESELGAGSEFFLEFPS
jgi:two-component system phosphate regulon sensor histidine kinase PhoR